MLADTISIALCFLSHCGRGYKCAMDESIASFLIISEVYKMARAILLPCSALSGLSNIGF